MPKRAPKTSKSKTPAADRLLHTTGYTLHALNLGVLARAPGALNTAEKHAELVAAAVLEHATAAGGVATMLKHASGAVLASALRTMLFTMPAHLKARPVFKTFAEPLFEEVCSRLEATL